MSVHFCICTQRFSDLAACVSVRNFAKAVGLRFAYQAMDSTSLTGYLTRGHGTSSSVLSNSTKSIHLTADLALWNVVCLYWSAMCGKVVCFVNGPSVQCLGAFVCNSALSVGPVRNFLLYETTFCEVCFTRHSAACKVGRRTVND